jgi:transcriptional regulator with XRE-family HTH domain
VRMTETVIKQVRQLMEKQGVSQGELSRRTGIERPNITRMLSGRSGKVPESWQKVLDELGLELIVVSKQQATKKS